MEPLKAPPDPGPPHWLDDPAHVRLLWRGFLVVLALTVVAQFVVGLHPHFAVERLFGFNAAYGLLACAAMIGVAKLLALWIKRPDDYYRSDLAEPPASSPTHPGSGHHD